MIFFIFQSLVERLQLNAEDIAIQPVHPSIIGQDTWFQITYTTSGTTRYFSCQSSKERDEWISSLKKTLMLNEDRRRTDNSLKLDVLEIKGKQKKTGIFEHKGQLISKADFTVFIWTKKPTKIFLFFCPSTLKWVKSKKECKLLYYLF